MVLTMKLKRDESNFIPFLIHSILLSMTLFQCLGYIFLEIIDVLGTD